MTLGDEEAQALVSTRARLRLVVVAAATLITAAAVSVSGIIGWIGLLIPHFARLLSAPISRDSAGGGASRRRLFARRRYVGPDDLDVSRFRSAC